MSNSHLEHLQERLAFFTEELQHHSVFHRYWNRLSLILKGSMAHGAVDRISDIDLTLFCDQAVHDEIAEKCHAAGLTSSPLGVFFPLDPQWTGHCNLETFEALTKRMAKGVHYEMWEASCCRPLHDPGDRFASIVAAGLQDAYTPEKVQGYIKEEFLPAILNFDSIQNPMRRGDTLDTMLTAATCIRQVCRLFYLLDGRPYPNDKWIGRYLHTTSLGAPAADTLRRLAATISRERPEEERLLPLEAYPEYTELGNLMVSLMQTLNQRYDHPVWVDHWFLKYH